MRSVKLDLGLAVEVKRRLEPRGVVQIAARWRALSRKEPGLVVAPYLSSAVRERLEEASLGFLDLTGNARIELREPGLFIEGKRADTVHNRGARPSRSLRGAKAGRIVRLLVDCSSAAHGHLRRESGARRL